MTQPPRRQIDRLKTEAFKKGLTRKEVKRFGPLTKRDTWEKAIAFYRTPDLTTWEGESTKSVDNIIHTPTRPHSFFAWIDLPQLAAVILLVAGLFVAIGPTLRKMPNLFPVKINIQIGTKL